jgi:aarF domain-containing kinase
MRTRRIPRALALVPPFGLISSGLPNDENSDWIMAVRRSYKFYSNALPAFVEYKYCDITTTMESDRAIKFSVLHKKYSPVFEKLALDLGGYYLKAAQLMSTQSHFVPKEYMRWCVKLQDAAPPTITSIEAQNLLNEAVREGSSLGSIALESSPIGSASIGVVYRGKILDTGTTVAVKIQPKHIERQFKSDMNVLRSFCAFALPHLIVGLKEIEAHFLTEFDYSREAENMKKMRANLSKFDARIEIPHPLFASKNILVMTYLEGETLGNYAKRSFKRLGIDEVDLDDLETIRATLKQKLKFSKLISFITLGFYNSTGHIENILDLLLDVHGYQVLVNGEFNGDPHPGNIMILKNGKLGLIDFGQIKKISQETRFAIAKLILAVNEGDKEKTTLILNSLGLSSKLNDPNTQFRAISFWLDQENPELMLNLNTHKFLEEMERRDPIVTMSGDLVMVCRCAMILRSIADSILFDKRVRITDHWKKYANLILENIH